METERKYQLSRLPEGLTDGVVIRQGYLSVGDPEVRVRDRSGKDSGEFFLTRKGGEGFSREEDEYEIPKEVFLILWPLTEGKRIEKIRYMVEADDGLVWEIDEYLGDLGGLVVAEVELPTESTEAIPPQSIAEVIGADVTMDKAYKNKRLATDGMPIRL